MPHRANLQTLQLEHLESTTSFQTSLSNQTCAEKSEQTFNIIEQSDRTRAEDMRWASQSVVNVQSPTQRRQRSLIEWKDERSLHLLAVHSAQQPRQGTH